MSRLYELLKSNSRDSLIPLYRAMFLHYIAYGVMQTLALVSETAPGEPLFDRLLQHIPVIPELQYINSTFWMVGLFVSLAILIFRDRAGSIDYLQIGAAISLFRGIFIFVTPLGAIGYVPEIMQNLTIDDITLPLLIKQWVPIDVLWGGSGYSAAYLTRDLFFSGHTSSTFLFLLLYKRKDLFYYWLLLYHFVTVGALFFTHEHYTIDVMGGYFVAYAIYKFFQSRSWMMSQT